MTPDQIDLARRLVACRRWRWMPGMLWSIGPEPGWVRASTGRVLSAHEDGGPVRAPRSCLPDLTDPATAGCLLTMLVGVDPGGGWVVSYVPDVGWRATSCDHDLSGATCGEALARALLVVWEAAP